MEKNKHICENCGADIKEVGFTSVEPASLLKKWQWDKQENDFIKEDEQIIKDKASKITIELVEFACSNCHEVIDTP